MWTFITMTIQLDGYGVPVAGMDIEEMQRVEDFFLHKMTAHARKLKCTFLSRTMMPPRPSSQTDESSLEFSDDDSNVSVNEDEEPNLGNDPSRDEDSDSPAALVRRETQAVNVLRGVVLLVLVCAAAGAATAVYFVISNAEEQSFRDDFESIATKIVQSFISDLGTKFYMSQTVSAAMTGFMQGTKSTHLNLTLENFDDLVWTHRVLGLSAAVFFSPYLKTEQERAAFEKYAADSVSMNASEMEGSYACWLCGGRDRGFANPKDEVFIPTYGLLDCGLVEDAARNGLISSEICGLARDVISSVCVCEDRQDVKDIEANRTVADGMFTVKDGVVVNDSSRPPYHPIWQASFPAGVRSSILYNQASESRRSQTLDYVVRTKLPAMTESFVPTKGSFYEIFGTGDTDPRSILYFPVFVPNSGKQTVAGTLGMEFRWKFFLTTPLPPGSEHVDIVVQNTCGQSQTFRSNQGTQGSRDVGLEVVGEGDLHSLKYERLAVNSSFEEYDTTRSFSATGSYEAAEGSAEDSCRFRFIVYPTPEMEAQYITNQPVVYAILAVAILFFTSIIFVMYDYIVHSRQRKVMKSARRTNAIVRSLFPQIVRDRLYQREQAEHAAGEGKHHGKLLAHQRPWGTKDHKTMGDHGDITRSDPVADLYPHATVLFLDIAGFTAWSSERDATQVFRLLETLYAAYDRTAKTMGVFKVETVGDCYVAVAGVPEPRNDHAVVMVRFASECRKLMSKLTRDLEVQLGPSTSDLNVRCGLHSGPVTAGVLRGERARFQLFGDTMNMASRMESTGQRNKIQVSQETVDLLVQAGKADWIRPRSDLVSVKGKGQMQTYWVEPHKRSTKDSSSGCTTHSSEQSDDRQMEHIPQARRWASESTSRDIKSNTTKLQKVTRLIEWNVEVLSSLLLNVVARREAGKQRTRSVHAPKAGILQSQGQVLDEMAEVISMPRFDAEVAMAANTIQVKLDTNVGEELHEFVTLVASRYRVVPFHNFQHASHVTMSAAKLMKRILSPKGIDTGGDRVEQLRQIHNLTYGMSSDPLMQFAIVFSALIHDVDHTGLPNAALVKMETPTAIAYKNKSVAEQNSVDVAWALLMRPNFENLRACIYSTQSELRRFRQILVNAVMATDIADKDLRDLRKTQWDRAFDALEQQAPDSDRKATIVMDCILQASDVSHTMQHFLTYMKWNERLFQERYLAYLDGHEAKDPSIGWYEGEIGFFDFYIIPLAKKLKECGIFGVSYDELLSYAQQNRAEWAQKGQELVTKMQKDAFGNLLHRRTEI